jgi:hypothetical protein
MKIKLIACEVFSRELRIAAAKSKQVVDCIFLPFGLHSTPNDLRARIQSEIDSAEDNNYDYIALGYCLCSRGTANLLARSIPIVIPRAHDCITLFLGSRARYSAEFIEHPGTYYYSPGWIERSDGETEQGYITETKERQMRERYVEYVEKYGEDNAKFLMEQESQWLVNYTRAAFINMNVGNVESYRDFVCRVASSHTWEYQEIEGDMSLIYRLAGGPWSDDEFLIIRPEEQVIETFDELVIGIRGPE